MNRSQGCALLIAGLALAAIGAADAPPDGVSGIYNVRAFGAKGDGVALDTDAINRAIDAASAAGGGTVAFPAGTYLAMSVHLKSDVTLELGAGSTLAAATPASDTGGYDAPEANPDAGAYQDFGHAHWHNSLIWGDGLHDIGIVGPGRILGTGLVRDYTAQAATGNKAIALKLCRNVTLRDVTIQHGGWFGILATGVDNLTIDNVKIDTNRDGMDIDCCRNVHVENCTVNSPNDDGICLKSSYGLGFARATENVTITNCQVSGYDEGTLLDGTLGRHGREPTGRIKFGTESNGGFKNITVSNCVFAYCRGLALEEVDGGALEDVSISNITMRDIVNAPIFLRLAGRLRGPRGTTMGTLRRVSISHVTVYNAEPRSAVIIAGVPDGLVEDVRLQDIRLWYAGGGTADQAAVTPKEDERGYPEPDSLGTMPAYGLFLRHVRGLTLDGIETRTLTPDLRPAFRLDDVANVTLSAIDAQHAPDVPTIALTGVSDFTLRDAAGLSDKRIKQADRTSM